MRSLPPSLARSTLDAAPDAMLIVDRSGAIVFANRRSTAIFGYEHDELVGLPIDQLLPERYRAPHRGHRSAYFENGRPRPMGAGFDLFARRRHGEEFPVEISLSPVETAGDPLVVAAIRDVTDRKRVEAELIEARNSARESQQVAEQARNLADRANQAKSRFLATASHDLRQPLQTLSMLNRTLGSLVKDPAAREVLEQEQKTLAAMSRLLHALLDISKLESGAVRPEPTDFAVASVLEELRQEFLDLASDKGLTLQVEPSTDRAHSDPNLVEELLRNLVSNAIKYTRSGWVRLRSLREAAGVRIEVLDSGIGIASDQIGLIFDEFYQVGVPVNTTRNGYGLGLSIVQRIARLLDIGLDVRSEPGRGSMFSVVLPPARTAGDIPSPTACEPSAPVSARSGRVLLVEDEPSVRQATQLLLTVEGYEVEAAGSLTEAVEIARRQPFDLLVTDFHLPGGATGQDVIEAVRTAQGQPTPALLVTGDTSPFIESLTQGAGRGLRIISKPVDADEMLRLLEVLRVPAPAL